MLSININIILFFTSIILIITHVCDQLLLKGAKFNYKYFLLIKLFGNKIALYVTGFIFCTYFINELLLTKPVIIIFSDFFWDIVMLFLHFALIVDNLQEAEYFKSNYKRDSTLPNVALLSYEPIISEIKNYLPEAIIKNIIVEYIGNLCIPYEELKNDDYTNNIVLNDTVFELQEYYTDKLKFVNKRFIPYNIVIKNDFEYIFDDYKVVRLNHKFRIIKFLSKNETIHKFLQFLCYNFSKSQSLNFRICSVTASESYLCFLYLPYREGYLIDPPCITIFSHALKKIMCIKFRPLIYFNLMKIDSYADTFLILTYDGKGNKKLLRIIILEIKNKKVTFSQYLEEDFYYCDQFKIFEDRLFLCCYKNGIQMRTIKNILKNKTGCNISYECEFF